MELKELRSFCAAVQFQSITKAAEHLNIAQPTLTGHIRKLEREFDRELLDRINRPIAATSIGSILVSLASSHVEALDSIKHLTLKAESERSVSVGSIHDLIPHTLLRLVREFRAKNSDAQINIRSGLSTDIRTYVLNREVDLGFVSIPMESSKITYTKLFAYNRVLITPLNHPLLKVDHLSLEAIGAWPIIFSQPGRLTRELIEGEFRRAGIKYETAMSLPDTDMIKPYVALGVGISIGNEFALDPGDYSEIGIRSLNHLLPAGEVGIIKERDSKLSNSARLFIQLIEDTFQLTITY